MTHRKTFTFLITLIMLFSVAFAAVGLGEQKVFADTYAVDGGRLTYNFDDNDLSDFDLYTEFDKKPYAMDGKLYFWVLAEQKAILKNKRYTDVDVNVDIMTINKSGKFDSGIYVQTSSVSNLKDGITAWNVNLERGADQNTYYLKLHRFMGGTYAGCIEEKGGLKLPMNKVHLRVVVKDGMLYAFVNNNSTPTFSHYIGMAAGGVGLRNYYSPNYFDNFTVIGSGNSFNYSRLDKLLQQAQDLVKKDLTLSSKTALESAISNAQNLKEQNHTQYDIDDGEKMLEKAIDGALEKRTYAQLQNAIEKAKTIENPNGKIYNKNSWATLQSVIAICQGLREESGEDVISYWTYRLELKTEKLVPYAKGGNA